MNLFFFSLDRDKMSKSTFIPMPVENGKTLYLNINTIIGFQDKDVDKKKCLLVHASYTNMAGSSHPRIYTVCEEHKAYHILKYNMVANQQSSYQKDLNDILKQ